MSNFTKISWIATSVDEYLKVLINKLQTPLRTYICDDLYSRVVKQVNTNEVNADVHMMVQVLNHIPKWDDSLIQAETDRVLGNVNDTKTIQNVLKVILVGKAAMLASVNPEHLKTVGNFNIRVPKNNEFIYNVLTKLSMFILLNPTVISVSRADSNQDKLAKLYYIDKSIKNSIVEAFSDFLPVNDILETYVSGMNATTTDSSHKISIVPEEQIRYPIINKKSNTTPLTSSINHQIQTLPIATPLTSTLNQPIHTSTNSDEIKQSSLKEKHGNIEIPGFSDLVVANNSLDTSIKLSSNEFESSLHALLGKSEPKKNVHFGQEFKI